MINNSEKVSAEIIAESFTDKFFLMPSKKNQKEFVYFERFIILDENSKFSIFKETKRKKVIDLFKEKSFDDTFENKERLLSFSGQQYKVAAQQIFKNIKLHPKINYKHGDSLIKEIKKIICFPPKTWEETMEEEEKKWIFEQFSILSKDYKDCSNFRAAKSNKKSQRNRYKRMKNSNKKDIPFDTKVSRNGLDYFLGFHHK